MANELEAIYSVLSYLRVQDLKDILRDVGDRVSGNKPALIDRLKERLATARMSNPLQYKRLQDLININLPSHLRFQVNDSSLITEQHSNHPNPHVPSAAFPSTSSGLPPHSPLKIKISRPNTSSVSSPSSSRITETVPVEPGTAVPGPIPVSPFIESISSQYTGRIEWTNLSWRIQPFYEIVGIVAGKKFTAGRDTIFNFTFTPQQAALLREPSYRVVYLSTNIEAAIVGSRVLYRDNKQYRPCAFLDMMYVDRAFVNGTYVSDVPQKTKGLKKKFGTINPLDITRYCKIPHSQMNQMNLLYLGNSSFVGAIVIVRKKSVENVLRYIQDHKVMTKEERLEQIKQIDEDDDDVIATNSMISVKDPLSYTRIQVPIRNRSCRHLECFDANMYLRMNEQTPTHTCPRCHQPFGSVSQFTIDNIMNVGPAFKKYLKEYDMSLDKLVGLNPFRDIVIDGYFMAVLKSIHDEDVDSFVVFPNGTWRLHKEEPIDDLDDDDEYGDRNSGMSNGKKEGSSQSVSSSRRNGPPAENPVVIDLTFDSDEEDVAPAPVPSAPSLPASSASVPPSSLTVADLFLRNSLSPLMQPTDTGGNRIGSITVPPTSSRPSVPRSGQSSSANPSTSNTNSQAGMLSSTSTTRPSSLVQNPPITTPPLPGLASHPISLPTSNVPSTVNGIQSSSFYPPGTLATSTLSSLLSPAGATNQTSYFQNPYPGQLGMGTRPGTIGSIPMTSPLLPYDPQNMALLSQQLNVQQRLADMQRAQRESSQSSLTGSSQPSFSIPPPLTAPPRPVSSTAHNGIPLTAASSSTPTQPTTTLPSIDQVIYPPGSKRPREEDSADGHPSKRTGSMDSSNSGGGGDTGSLNSSVRSGNTEQRRQDFLSSPPYRGGDRFMPSSSSSNSYRSRREDSGSSTGSDRDREWDRGRDRGRDRDGCRTNDRYWISNTDRDRDRDRDWDRR